MRFAARPFSRPFFGFFFEPKRLAASGLTLLLLSSVVPSSIVAKPQNGNGRPNVPFESTRRPNAPTPPAMPLAPAANRAEHAPVKTREQLLANLVDLTPDIAPEPAGNAKAAPGGTSAAMVVGERRVFAVVPRDANGNAVHGLSAAWVSNNPAVVEIAPNGEARAVSVGNAVLTASIGARTRIISVSVTRPVSPTVKANEFKREEGKAKAAPRRAILLKRKGEAKKSLSPTALVQGGYTEDQQRLFGANNAVGTPPGRTQPGGTTSGVASGSAETSGDENFTFGVPLVSLPGRGVSVDLGLSYNSRMWSRSVNSGGTTSMKYDADPSWVSPGFFLGYGQISHVGLYSTYPSVLNLTSPNGTRTQLAYQYTDSNGKDIFTSADGSNLTFLADSQFEDPYFVFMGGQLFLPGGGRIDYSTGTFRTRYPNKIVDRNGNYILISYPGTDGRISSVQDTLGRYVTFQYDGSNRLTSIKVPGYGTSSDRTVAEFAYQSLTINGTFASGIVRTPASAETRSMLKYVRFPGTGMGYRYDYSAYGMIYRMAQLVSMTSDGSGGYTGTEAASTEYNYPLTTPSPAPSKVPTYTTRTDDWAGRTTSSAAVTSFSNSVSGTVRTTTVTNPDGTKLETKQTINTGVWNDGVIDSVRFLKSDGTTEMSVQNNTWTQNGSRPQLTRTAAKDEAGNWTSQTFTYNSYDLVTETKEFDCQSCTTPVLRSSTTDYITTQSYLDRKLFMLPTSQKIYDGSGTLVARTDNFYDETSREACTGITMFEDPGTSVRGNLTTTKQYPDLSNLSNFVSDTVSYDVAGNARIMSASCCKQREILYSALYNYAYPTWVKRGDAAQLNASTTYDGNTGLVNFETDEDNVTSVVYSYDSATLRLLAVTYPDGGEVTHTYYDDLMTYPAGTSRKAFRKETRVKMPSGYTYPTVPSIQIFDGRGSTLRSAAWMPEGWLANDAEYDIMGRVIKTDNPYFVSSNDSQTGKPNQFTTRQYDEQGRMWKIFACDSGTTPIFQATFSGRVTTAQDAIGRQKRSFVDALGRLVRVDEPNDAGQLGTEASPNQATYYTYNTLDQLIRVEQGVQNRYFRYDAMGRPTHQRHPEQDAPHSFTDSLTSNNSWSSKTEYDSLGRVQYSYDARNLRSEMIYDGINRVTEINVKKYVSGSWVADPDTPVKSFAYGDNPPSGLTAPAYGKGRIMRVKADSSDDKRDSEILIGEYDKMGRVKSQTQKLWNTTSNAWVSYTTSRAYDLTGAVTSQTYPSGRTVNYGYDSVGRLAYFNGNLGGSSGTVWYAGGMFYNQWGKYWEEYGTTTTLRKFNGFTARGERSFVLLGTQTGDPTGWNRGMLVYNYSTSGWGTSGADNTGQVRRMHHYAPDNDSVSTWKLTFQDYEYDTLGRLTQVKESSGVGVSGSGETLTWDQVKQKFTYDRYGNRSIDAANTVNANNKQYTVTAGTNRLSVPSGQSGTMAYDAAGNLTTDTYTRSGMGSGTRSYDADGRMIKADVATSQFEEHVYDASGKRVKVTSNVSGRPEVWYVYGIDGELIAEYSGTFTATSPSAEYGWREGEPLVEARSSTDIRWKVSDNLGTPRIIFTETGSLANVTRQDFLPFGEELYSGTAGRSTGNGYSTVPSQNPADNPKQQVFTGLERDKATGLDHTWFRKNDSLMGRWSSPDPYWGSANVNDPQSFNRLSYVRNSPTDLIDPMGLEGICVKVQTTTAHVWRNQRTGQVIKWEVGETSSMTHCYLQNGPQSRPRRRKGNPGTPPKSAPGTNFNYFDCASCIKQAVFGQGGCKSTYNNAVSVANGQFNADVNYAIAKLTIAGILVAGAFFYGKQPAGREAARWLLGASAISGAEGLTHLFNAVTVEERKRRIAYDAADRDYESCIRRAINECPACAEFNNPKGREEMRHFLGLPDSIVPNKPQYVK